jgi:hypothetical protein
LEELDKVQGRGWDDVDVSRALIPLTLPIQAERNRWLDDVNIVVPRSTDGKTCFRLRDGDGLGVGGGRRFWRSGIRRQADILMLS